MAGQVKRYRSGKTKKIKYGKGIIPRGIYPMRDYDFTTKVEKIIARSEELKYVDTESNVGINEDSVFQVVNLTAAGTGSYQRIGKKIRGVSLHVKIALYATTTAGMQYNYDIQRYIVVYDRQTNGATPAVSTLLESVDNAGTSTTNPFSGRNMAYLDRYIVLADKRKVKGCSLSSAVPINDPSIPDANLHVEFHIKLKGLETLYTGTTAAIGSVATGSIYVLCLGTNDSAGGVYPYGCFIKARYTYRDS